MQKFDVIYERALKRKGAEALEQALARPKTATQLRKIDDAEMLREMTKCVFRSGFVWKIIEAKWPGFEAAFHGFDVKRCAMLSDEELEQLGGNEAIVRHDKKNRQRARQTLATFSRCAKSTQASDAILLPGPAMISLVCGTS